MTDKVRGWYIPHKRVTKETVGPSMTKQSFKDECDVNNIMKKFERDGLLDHVSRVEGQYTDFSDAPGDFHEAMNAVRKAQEMFESVPASIRAEFGNDPGAFLDWATTAPVEELRERGLMPAITKDRIPDPAPAVDPPATPPSSSPEGDSGPAGT